MADRGAASVKREDGGARVREPTEGSECNEIDLNTSAEGRAPDQRSLHALVYIARTFPEAHHYYLLC